MGQHTPSLLDADKCIQLDCNWSKGYTRKGDVLYAMKKFTECYNAYNSALRITPNDVSAKEKCELAQKAIRDSTSDTPSASSSTAAPSTGKKNTITQVQTYIRVLAIVSAFLFFIPFFPRGFSARCFQIFVFSSIFDFGASLYAAHGMPKFNMQYAQTLLLDPTTMYFFLSLLLLAGKPYLLAMAPLILTEMAHVAYYTYTMLASKMPAQIDRITAVTGT
jgi:tetratricopeptide (TPR) repeat protein